MNWNGCRRKPLWLHFRYYFPACLEELEMTTRNRDNYYLLTGQGLSSVSPDCEESVPTTLLWLSFFFSSFHLLVLLFFIKVTSSGHFLNASVLFMYMVRKSFRVWKSNFNVYRVLKSTLYSILGLWNIFSTIKFSL
jgi:hypothetical protein